jgi:hypothetical protein
MSKVNVTYRHAAKLGTAWLPQALMSSYRRSCGFAQKYLSGFATYQEVRIYLGVPAFQYPNGSTIGHDVFKLFYTPVYLHRDDVHANQLVGTLPRHVSFANIWAALIRSR